MAGYKCRQSSCVENRSTEIASSSLRNNVLTLILIPYLLRDQKSQVPPPSTHHLCTQHLSQVLIFHQVRYFKTYLYAEGKSTQIMIIQLQLCNLIQSSKFIMLKNVHIYPGFPVVFNHRFPKMWKIPHLRNYIIFGRDFLSDCVFLRTNSLLVELLPDKHCAYCPGQRWGSLLLTGYFLRNVRRFLLGSQIRQKHCDR